MGILDHIRIQTNGVSFSLVAGATCFTWFSNKVSNYNLRNATLNINSTGAKSINVGAINSGHAMGHGDNLDDTGSQGVLFTYTGTVYYMIGRGLYYPDYGD